MFVSFLEELKKIEKNQELLIKSIITLRIPANEASAKAPLGPTLGQYGILISDFCERFNELTNIYTNGTLINTRIVLFGDLTYNIYLSKVDFIYFIKKVIVGFKFSPFGKRLYLNKSKLVKYITTPVLYESSKYYYTNVGIPKYISFYNFYKMIPSMVRNIGLINLSRQSIRPLIRVE